MAKVEELERQQDGTVRCSATYPWSNGEQWILNERRTKFVPHHYIDYFVGTSTGGLSAMMLGRLQMTVSEALAKYDHVGNKVFGRPRKTTVHGIRIPLYKSRYMNRALQHSTQQDVLQRLNHGSPDNIAGFSNTYEAIRDRADRVILRNENQGAARTIVVSFAGTGNLETYLFRSYDHSKPPDPLIVVRNPGPASDWPLWKVGRATSAALPYFSEFKEGKSEYLDGAFGFHNNPSDLAYTEVTQMHWAHDPLIVISIGTGIGGQLGNQRRKKFRGFLKHIRGLIVHGKTFIKRVLDSQPQHERFEGRINGINDGRPDATKVKYFRFNIPREFDLPGSIELDDWRGENGEQTKRDMKSAVYEYISRESEEVRRCAHELVDLRRRRAMTERWEEFALHLAYTCSEPGCQSPAFTSRFKLREHAVQVHGFLWQVPCVSDDGTVIAPWACYRDHCGRNQVMCFKTRADFEQHSDRAHGIPNPTILPVDEFNLWLDQCRGLKPVPLPRQEMVVEQHQDNV